MIEFSLAANKNSLVPGVNRHQRRLFGLSCTISACTLFNSLTEVTGGVPRSRYY